MREPILLFYDGFERRALPGAAGMLKSQARRGARFVWRTIRRKQTRTGFYTAFLALHHGLEKAGYSVRVNDFAAALRSPSTPIGVAGYPSVLAAVNDLPNPRVFGPGDFGPPDQSESLAHDPRYRILTQPCDWFADIYTAHCGKRVRPWFVGIDTESLKPPADPHKDIDFVVYDKIRWRREHYAAGLVSRLKAALSREGRTSYWVRYGEHHRDEFFGACRSAKAMIFLCEHETQGIAYQEAMAMGLPILAWDEGVLADPTLAPFAQKDTVVSSVPYFDDRCGRTFKEDDLEPVLTQFWRDLDTFRPRDYVKSHLSPEESARRWMSFWREAGGRTD